MSLPIEGDSPRPETLPSERVEYKVAKNAFTAVGALALRHGSTKTTEIHQAIINGKFYLDEVDKGGHILIEKPGQPISVLEDNYPHTTEGDLFIDLKLNMRLEQKRELEELATRHGISPDEELTKLFLLSKDLYDAVEVLNAKVLLEGADKIIHETYPTIPSRQN